MTDKELLEELAKRLAVTHKDYAALEAKYLECTKKLREYQGYKFWTAEELDEYVRKAGWEPDALRPAHKHNLRGVVEAYLRHCGMY